MDKLVQIGLIHELKEKLKQIDPGMQPEKAFTEILPTKRLFRADFYLPKLRMIIEINGGQWVSGRHNRGGSGYETDLEKLNLASLHGIRVIQFTYEMLQRGDHLKLIEQLKNHKS